MSGLWGHLCPVLRPPPAPLIVPALLTGLPPSIHPAVLISSPVVISVAAALPATSPPLVITASSLLQRGQLSLGVWTARDAPRRYGMARQTAAAAAAAAAHEPPTDALHAQQSQSGPLMYVPGSGRPVQWNRERRVVIERAMARRVGGGSGGADSPTVAWPSGPEVDIGGTGRPGVWRLQQQGTAAV